MNYWPSVCVYAFMALTLLIMLVQGWFPHSVKLTIAAHNASKHFPELDFESCGLCGEPIRRSWETVPLKNTETDDAEKDPVSAAGEHSFDVNAQKISVCIPMIGVSLLAWGLHDISPILLNDSKYESALDA